jgi:SRSO17 transposase
VSAAELLGARQEVFRPISWRIGTKGPLRAEFAALRVRVADGLVAARAQHLPGEEAWLVGERRATGERKYYLTNHPADTPLEVLAALIKARWVCEQMHQQLKDELGLDHFEGRSWRGLHHHALLCRLAFAFLQHLRLGLGGERRRNPARARTAAATEPAGDPAAQRGGPDPRAPAPPALPAALRPSPSALNVAA